MEYLDFELPIKELMEQYQTCSLVGERKWCRYEIGLQPN